MSIANRLYGEQEFPICPVSKAQMMLQAISYIILFKIQRGAGLLTCYLEHCALVGCPGPTFFPTPSLVLLPVFNLNSLQGFL